MSYRRFTRWFSAAMLGLAFVGRAVAQDTDDRNAALEKLREQRRAQIEAMARARVDGVVVGADPTSLAGKDSTESVYVRDSALALEKLAVAQRMERLKEWNKSADLYQEVIEKYPDRVVPSHTDKDERIIQYTSVTRGVMERLAKWPREGLDVYRGRFEPAAAALLPASDNASVTPNTAAMHRVYSRYFITDTAKRAGLQLMDINFERGEFQSAARLADELLDWHPDLAAERPVLLYRASLAHRLAGDDTKATQRRTTLQKDHADALGTVRGQEVKLAESLAKELADLKPLTDVASSADSWTTFGGDASRGRVASAAGRPGARLYRVALSKPQWRNLPSAARNDLETTVARQAAEGRTTGVMPVVDRGELFFQDGTRVFARSLESGNPLPGWAQNYPGPPDRAGQYALPNAAGSPRTHQNTLTLTDRAILGIMGQPDRNLASLGTPGESRLVSLDRQTGKENWLIALSGLELPNELPEDQQKSIRSLVMNGSPLVVGGNVMVLARGTKQAQFEDCWVLCFDLATGKYRWSCYVASASTAGAQWGIQNLGAESTSHLAYADGRIYAITNLGALAAIDAYSGTIVWLNIYQRGTSLFDPNQPFNPFAAQANMQGASGPGRPWIYNPVIVKAGHVFVLPPEGQNLYVYDAGTGAEVRQIRKADFGNADMLLAVLGERMILAGEKRIFCLNWRTYDMAKPDASLVWSSVEFPDGLRGRPFVTADSVFVTNSSRLSHLNLNTGRVEDAYPKNWKPWDAKEEGPGNVLVSGDYVVVAGANHVYGFTDLALARARLDKAVATAPNDTAPRVRYAEILFTAGEPVAAIAKLDEAIQLLGGIKSMRTGSGRDWIFNTALSYAQKLSDSDVPDASKLATELYNRAAAAASTPTQHVHYRLGRARYAESSKDAPGAVKLYQEILSEPELRTVSLLDEATGGPTQAALVAERAVGTLITKAGAAVYESFEQAAAAQLSAAQAVSPPKPDQLLAVAQTFPNSKVAPQAMIAAAAAYEAAKNPRSAVQVLRQIYFKYPENPEKARIIESMARNYLALPHRVEVAAARLAQGVALQGEHKLTQPLQLPDGQTIAKDTTFSIALDALRKYGSVAAAKNLPDFKLPVPPKYQTPGRPRNPRWPFPAPGSEQIIDNIAAIAVPQRDFARADRVVAWSSDGTLSIFEVGKPQPIGKCKALKEPPRGSAWAGDGVLVWNNSAIALAPEAGGKTTWAVELKDLPAVEIIKSAVVQDGIQPANRRNALQQFQLQRRNNAAFVMQDGIPRQLPQGGLQDRPNPNAAEQITDVRPVGDRVIVGTSTGQLFSIDLSSGQIAWQTRLGDRPADRIAANEDFTVLKLSDDTSVRLIAMDTFTGQIRGSRGFPLTTGVVPGNIALSADGTLVYSLPDRLVLKDLYKPWDAPDRDIAGALPGDLAGVQPFINATGPDQLLIAEGRILALAEVSNVPVGNNVKAVRLHSLETGQPISLRVPQEDGTIDLQLGVGTDSWDVKLRVIGSRLYIINPRTILCYNLDRPEEFWEGWVDEADEENLPNIRDAYFGKNHVVLLSEPGLPDTGKKDRQMLLAYARYPGKAGDTAESGRIDYEPSFVEPHSIKQWQGVEGGFYYVSGDSKLHFVSAENEK
jgi:outer membrane protein assembly factor BamB